MRVLQVCQSHPPEFSGGSSGYAIELATKLGQSGFATEVLCGTRSSSLDAYELQIEKEEKYYVTRMGLPKKRGYGAGHIQKVRKVLTAFLAEKKFDVVHFHSATGIGEGIIGATHDLGIPCVVTVHEGWWLCANLYFRNNHRKTICESGNLVKCIVCQVMGVPWLGGKKWLRNIAHSARYCNWILNHRTHCLSDVDQIIAVCDFIKEKYLQFGVNRPITVIKNRVDQSKIYFKPIQKAKLPLRLGALGIFRSRKDGDLLIKAFSLLAGRRGDFILHVWSSVDDKYRAMYDAFCRKFNVVNHGPYGPDDLNNIFSDTDLLVYPSSSADTYPLTLLESLASRTPIVAARSHGMAEIVSDGENGKSFEPLNAVSLAKAIEYFLQNPERVEAIQEKITPPSPYGELVRGVTRIYENLCLRGGELSVRSGFHD
jgi:glycosyltransferase involved in cell wall biosynthesis